MQMQIHLQKPQNLIDALEIATAMETFEKPKGLGAGKKPKGETVAPVTSSKPSKPMPKANETQTARPQQTVSPASQPPPLLTLNTQAPSYSNVDNSQSAFPEINCYYCKEFGHYKSSCAKLKAILARDAQAQNGPRAPSHPGPSTNMQQLN